MADPGDFMAPPAAGAGAGDAPEAFAAAIVCVDMCRVDEHDEQPLQRFIYQMALLADERVLAVAARDRSGATRIVYVDTNVRGAAGIQAVGDARWWVSYMGALSDGGLVLGIPDSPGGVTALVIPPQDVRGSRRWDAYPPCTLKDVNMPLAREICLGARANLYGVLSDDRLIAVQKAMPFQQASVGVWDTAAPIVPSSNDDDEEDGGGAVTVPTRVADLQGHDMRVVTAVRLPSERLLTVDGLYVFRVWDVREGHYAPLGRWESYFDSEGRAPLGGRHMMCPTPLPNGMVATGGDALRLWDVDAHACVAELDLPIRIRSVRWKLHCLQPLPDGLLAGGLENGHLCIWDLSTRTRIADVLAHDSSIITDLALLPDGRLVTAGYDGWIKMWKGPWSVPAARHAAWGRRMPAVAKTAELHNLFRN